MDVTENSQHLHNLFRMTRYRAPDKAFTLAAPHFDAPLHNLGSPNTTFWLYF